MKPITHKATQYLLATAKLLIVAGAFLFIYQRLSQTNASQRVLFFSQVKEQVNLFWFFILLVLTFLNRYFEIVKWQVLVSSFEKLSVQEAAKQVLAALTLSFITPNGIGEYGAKALFFSKQSAKRIVLLNLVCNGAQLLLTILFGLAGLLVVYSYYPQANNYLTLICLLLLVIMLTLFFTRKLQVKGYSLAVLLAKVVEIPRAIHYRNLLFALLRYMVFSHQYYLFFYLLHVPVSYPILMATIAAMYFVASVLPTMQIFDFAVKGGVAIYFFGLLGVSEWIPAFVATGMWLLNVALPVIIGSYFVISFKPVWKPL